MFYSQCGEDLFLVENFFRNKRNGTYIEMGALDGILYSNTKFFQDQLQWKGILIEPHPEKFKVLEQTRPNNYLFNDLVSCEKKELKFRYFVNGHAAVSGVESTLPKNHFDNYFENADCKTLEQKSIYIKPKSLTEIIKSTPIQHVDFLSLDVEGHEYEVLKSWDFTIPIDLILIEAFDEDRDKDELWKQILYKNNYQFITKCKHNDVFILRSSDLWKTNFPSVPIINITSLS